MDNQPILVTGGAGFIGSNFILQWLAAEDTPVVNLDKLTYAGNLGNLEKISADSALQFCSGRYWRPKISQRSPGAATRPRAVVHFAAESHVDRSIHGPDDFVRTNVNGTFSLLEEARAYWTELAQEEKAKFSLSARFDRRGLRLSRPERSGFLGDHAVLAQQPVLGHQGGF